MRHPSFRVLFSLCTLLLLQEHLTWARRSGSRGSSGKSSSSSSSSSSSWSWSSSSSSSSSGHKSSGSKTQQSGGGHSSQHPAGSYPARGSYPTQNKGGYSHQHPAGGGGTHNWNPKNPILSPRYGGGYQYGGSAHGGASPFAQSVENLGYQPDVKSKGFAKKAAVAVGVGAAAGVATGVAVGYGLGRYPRPPFSFRNPREEHYYNRYMYKRYGSRSTDEKDYGRDYYYKEPDVPYDSYMDSCMKRTDLLQDQEARDLARLQGDDPVAVVNGSKAGASAPLPGNGTLNTTTALDLAGGSDPNSSTPPESHPAQPIHPAAGVKEGGDREEEENTVSIVEIGYPELIEQMKARRCVEQYMEYSHAYLAMRTGAATQQRPLCQGVLLLLTTFLMFMSSSVLLQ